MTLTKAVEHSLPDGARLRADVYRPTGEGRWPVLLMRTPYRKEDAQTAAGYLHPAALARKGYVVAIQDTRGRSGSDGVFEPFVNEADDGYHAVEWAAGLPGSDGRVAMYGFSYAGATQLLAAGRRPPSLVAIAPAFTASSFYDGWTFEGGALSLCFAASWAVTLAHDGARARADRDAMAGLAGALADPSWLSALPLDRLPPLTRDSAPFFFDWLSHPSEDEYWLATSVRETYDEIRVPGLHVGGWYDPFLSGTIENFVQLQRRIGRQRLLIGPWTHAPWVPGPLNGAARSEAAAPKVDRCHLEWLDDVMRDGAGETDGSPVTVYVLGDGWRALDGWPPNGSSVAELYLHSGGHANSRCGDGTLSWDRSASEPPDVFVYDPLNPSLSAGGHSLGIGAPPPVGPASQLARESWRDVLVYTTAPLERDLELIGHVTLILHAATSAADTDFTARLCLVDPGGGSVNLTEGIVRARYRRSLAEPVPVTPGQVEEYRLGLGAVATVIPAGSALRLDVASSDFPHWDRNLNTGGALGSEGPEAAVLATQVVFHDSRHPSRLLVPTT